MFRISSSRKIPAPATALPTGSACGPSRRIHPLVLFAYSDASDVSHGFVRTASGAFTMFDAPGAGTSAGQGTFGNSVERGDGAVLIGNEAVKHIARLSSHAFPRRSVLCSIPYMILNRL